jgi:predicted HicB family RNase H-like nuclease
MSKAISVRVGDELHAQMKAAAAAENRTLSNWIVTVCQRALAETERSKPKK